MKRVFIAVKIPLSKKALEIILDIKNSFPNEKIKWVELWNFHITLHFFGEISDEKVNEVKNRLNQLFSNVKSLKLRIKGLGVFGGMKDPKVIWLGIENSDDLQYIKKQIDLLVEMLGFKLDKKAFKPHLTIARIRQLNSIDKLKMLTEKYSETVFDEVDIDKVLFYESKLTPTGPVYKILQEEKLT